MRKKFTIAVITCLLASCGGAGSSAPAAAADRPIQAAVQRVAIPRDSTVLMQVGAGESYVIYYPSSAPAIDSTPIILCLDPHAEGRLPIEKYRKLADRFGIAIAGSNSSKNGMTVQNGTEITGNMVADIINRLGFNKANVTLCGFSGGAKVAMSEAESDPAIHHIIYSGASSTINHAVDLLGFAGVQDMNYTDLLQFSDSYEQAYPGRSVLIEFGGKHEWPDSATFRNAFYWVSFHSVRKTDRIILNSFTKESNPAIAQAEASGNTLKMYQEYRIRYAMLNGISDVAAVKSKMASIRAGEAYQKAMSDKKLVLQKEADEKQLLIQAFQNQNVDWWQKVISHYRSSASPSDKRLLGFVSLGCYSYAGQMLQQRNVAGAEKILAIYELADPDNTDQLYFHAMLYAWTNKPDLALSYLHKAIKNGYKDSQKMEREEAFASLRTNASFIQMLDALKRGST